MGNGAEMAENVKPGAGRQGKRRKEQDVKKSGKYGRKGIHEESEKTLSTIENPTIYIYVHNGAAKLPRQGLRRKKKTGSTLQVLPAPNHFVHFEYGKTRKCEL